jgi:hypothetical protein
MYQKKYLPAAEYQKKKKNGLRFLVRADRFVGRPFGGGSAGRWTARIYRTGYVYP